MSDLELKEKQLFAMTQWPALTSDLGTKTTKTQPTCGHGHDIKTSSYLLEFHLISRWRSLLKGDSTHGLAIFLGKMSPFSSFMIPQDVVVMLSYLKRRQMMTMLLVWQLWTEWTSGTATTILYRPVVPGTQSHRARTSQYLVSQVDISETTIITEWDVIKLPVRVIHLLNINLELLQELEIATDNCS